MTKLLSFLFVVLLVITLTQPGFASENHATLAAKAVSENPSESTSAVAELRSLGPEGLKTLMEVNSQLINQYLANPTLVATPEWRRLTATLDVVSQQRNSYLSGLYWYTDITEAQKVSAATGKPGLLANYHRTRINRISVDWLNDNKKVGGKEPEGVLIDHDHNGNAVAIMPLAITKALSENSMLRAMMAVSETLGRTTDEEVWKKIAALHIDDARLDQRSIGLIRRQTRDLPNADKSLDRLLQAFQDSIALDTVRNEYKLHLKLYSWLMVERRRTDLAAFNEKVYAELFATPRSDPWLGLLQPEVYTGLDGAGISNK